MNRRLAIAILVLYVSSAGIVDAQEGAGPEATKLLAGKAAARIEAGDLDGAAAELQLPGSPLIALGASDLLIRHYYWQKKNLPVVVALSRNALRHGRNRAEAEPDETLRNKVLLKVKAIAYNLASFTWPGWGEEGVVISEEDREAGVRAAELNLRLAKGLDRGPKALSAAHWIIGAHQLTSGDAEFAVTSFRRAQEFSEAAGDRAGAMMNRGYVGIALVKSGQKAMGVGTVQSAVSQLEAEGSDDAKFYAGQVRDVYLRLLSPDSAHEGALTRIECGPVTLMVTISDTAILFLMVDQLSGWSRPPPARYRLPLKLDEEDEAALARYASIRRRKAGIDFGRYFSTDGTLDDALFAAAEDGVLNPAEVTVLSRVFARFGGARLREMRNGHEDALANFGEDLKSERLVNAVSTFARFIGVEPVEIVIYPIPDPAPDAATTTIHMITLELLTRKREELAKVAEKTPGLTVEILTSSTSYAFAEGIHHGTEGDPLAEKVRSHRRKGKRVSPGGGPFTDQAFGLALRPNLTEALKSATFADFLTMARISWKALHDNEAGERGK